MNLYEALIAKPFFQALGWALIHFIWQGAIVAALYAGARIMLRRASSNTRYSVACAAMLLMLVLPATTLIVAFPSPTDGGDGYSVSTSGAEAKAFAEDASTVSDLSGALWQHPAYSSSKEVAPSSSIYGSFKQWAETRFDAVLPWLVAMWFVGVFFLSIRFLGGLVLVQRLKSVETSPAVQIWQEKLTSLCEQLRLSRPVRLLESALVEVPTVIGWLRPVILVPASVFTGISAPQLEALLAHELAHIRRYDYLVNMIQTAVETLLFYHPAVWWVSSQVRQEREHCCDDLAVAVCNDVLVYARALAALEQIRSHMPQPAIAANGGSLLKRIQRLVGDPAPLSHRIDSWLAGLIAIATAFSILAGSQTAMLSSGTTAAEFRDGSSVSSPAASVEAASKGAAHSSSPAARQQMSSGALDASAAGDTEASESPSIQEQEAGTGSNEAPGQDRDSGSQDFIGEIAAEGYTNLTVEKLIALKTHGVTPEYIRTMNASFNSKVPVDDLIALRIHGASPQFIKEMREAGLDKLSAEKAIAFRIHGVTSQLVRELKEIGYADLSADKLVAFRIHGVTPAFVKEVKALGFNLPEDDELVALKIHGVTPEYLREMKPYAGARNSIEEILGMRIHGVTPEFIKGLNEIGYKDLDADDLVAFRIHGVSVQFIKSMQAAGFGNISSNDLTALRIHGVTPEFVQRVKSRGFTDVTIEQLIRLRQLNIIPSSGK